MWEPPDIDQRNGIVRYYIINVNFSGGELRQETSNSTQYNLTSLEPYNNYSVNIAAFTVDMGPYTSFHPFQTEEDGKLINTKLRGTCYT